MALVLADLAAILRRHDPATTASDRAPAPPGAPAPARPRAGRLPPGVLIGLATAVKLTPGIFILYLLVIRRTREAVTAAVAAVGGHRARLGC